MLWVAVFGVALVGSTGHEFPRGRIRFPYEGPPLPILGDLFMGPHIYAAESQSHPVLHESSSSLEYNHPPFNANSQKPPHPSPFADSGHYESGSSKPYINQHRSPPSRPREGQFHETQPPPFATPSIPQGAKLKGILNAPPPPPTPSLSSLVESGSWRHRFSGHRDPNYSEQHPNGPRPQGNDGHSPKLIHHEKHSNERHPGVVRDGSVPERLRPTQDRPPKGGERYKHQERYPAHSEKPLVYKQKAKIPFNNMKKPLFSPTVIDEKFNPKAPPRPSLPSQNDDYSRPPTSDEDNDYYHSKLSEEYYSGKQNTQYTEPAVQTRAQSNKNARPTAVKPKPAFDFNDMPFNFDLPNYGKPAESGSPFPSGSSMFPQSEEFGDFFDTSLPEWMNDFKGPPSESGSQGGKQHKQAAQETKRQPFKQPQATNYFGEHHSSEQEHNRYLNKRNPTQNKKNKNNFDDEDYDEKRYYNKPKVNSYSNSRAQPDPDSYYDAPDSTEFDFGSSSPEFNTQDQDFNTGSFNFRTPTTKSTGTEWIPINAPDGAIPAKSYEIPAPDLSQEYYRSQSQYESGEYQRDSTPSRRPSSRVEKSRERGDSNVVYGARNKGRQNEEVVSASVMVKQ